MVISIVWLISIIINNNIIIIISFIIFLSNYFSLTFFSIPIPADPNRVPHDLPEAESESIAGLITEYSPVYSPLILLTEYATDTNCGLYDFL